MFVRILYYAHLVGLNLIIIGAGLLGVVFLIISQHGYIRDEKAGIFGWVILLTGLALFACGKIYLKKYLRKPRERSEP